MKKKLITGILLIAGGLLPAQNFAPFNKDVTKRFYNSSNPSDDDYFFFAEDTSSPSPGIIVFHQYFASNQPFISTQPPFCSFWGGTRAIADTTWLGEKITYDDNSQHLTLINRNGDTLDFDFALAAGDSSVFYQNFSDKYYIRAGQVQQELVYTVNDAVKTFTILHLDSMGGAVQSPLHGTTIKLGDQTGLISFIDVFNFPAVEKNLSLKGQLNPLIGSYYIRFEDIYPFQPGDSMQFGASTTMADFVRNYRVETRSETADSVIITFKKFSVAPSGPVNISVLEPQVPDAYPATLRFPKNSDFFGSPHNSLKPGKQIVSYYYYETRSVVSTSLSYCGISPLYIVAAQAWEYCDSCNCYGDFDSYQQKFPSWSFASGAGVISAVDKTNRPWVYDNSIYLRYSSIGGVVCGSYLAVGTTENKIEAIKLFPNPVNNVLELSASVDHITILSNEGSTIRSVANPGKRIDLSDLIPGLYFAELKKEGRSVYYKLVKL